MHRTQIQLPDGLFKEVQTVARKLDWSVTEVLRRGAEYVVRCHRHSANANEPPPLPKPRSLGKFLAPVERWRELANE